MRSVGLAVLVVFALLIGLLPTGAAFPEYDEAVFHWRQENGTPGSGVGLGNTGCQLISQAPESADSTPCMALSYEVGNSDSHVFFRWTMAETGFGPLGAAALLRFEQKFTGSRDVEDPTENDFSFKGLWTSGADGPTTLEAKPEDWGDAIEWIVSDTQILASLPLELVATKMGGGASVGSNFTISDPEVYVNVVGVEHNNAWARGEQVQIEEGNRTFELQAYGSLQAPPEAPSTVFEEITGLAIERALSFDEATSMTYVYNWTVEAAAFNLSYEVEATNGSVGFTLTPPDGAASFEQAVLTGAANETFTEVAAGVWTIEIAFDEFVGSLRFALTEPTAAVGGPTGDGDGDGGQNGGDGNGTVDPGEGEEGLPAPGIALLVVALAALYGLRRRR